MKPRHSVFCLTATMLASAAVAQTMPTSIGHDHQLLVSALASGGKALRVTSPSFAAGGDIPLASTQYGANRFPGLNWSAGPAGTHSYAVVIQGELGQGPSAGTSVHLVLYNLPSTTTALPAGTITLPSGAAYGPNVHGPAAPYAGPHAHDSSRHAYHAQVFALDTVIHPDAAPDLAAMKR